MRHVRAVGIFLEEYVVLAVIISQAVCLIRPVGSRHTMESGAKPAISKSAWCYWECRLLVLFPHLIGCQHLIIYIDVINDTIECIDVERSELLFFV